MQHYYVGTTSADTTESQSDTDALQASQHGKVIAKEPKPRPVIPAIAALLALSEITVAPSGRRAGLQDALVDYSRSLLLTSKEYVIAMEEKACRREEARLESQLQREQVQKHRQ